MNALTTRAHTALQSGTGPVVAALFVALVAGSIGWAVTIAVLAVLALAGYVLGPWIEEQQAIAARRRDAIRERADRQHRWALHGDNRGVYGAERAEWMHNISREPSLDDIGDGGQQPAIATLAHTADDLAALLAERPVGWRYAAFASVLVQRYALLQPRLRDQQLGYAPKRHPRMLTRFALAQYMIDLLNQMLALLGQIEDVMLSPAFTRMFGDPTDGNTADADAIVHAANRLMDLHERLLSLAERCRGADVPGEHADIVRDCGRVLDLPLEGYRRFIDEFVARVAEMADVLPYARGTIALDPVMLDIEDNDELLAAAFAGLRKLAPGAR